MSQKPPTIFHITRTFNIEMPEDDVLLPGIGPSEMQHGDFVLQPRRNGYNEPLYKPLTVAFVVRPMIKGLQAVGRGIRGTFVSCLSLMSKVTLAISIVIIMRIFLICSRHCI
ncbi:hypothetical protein K505DRAFT_813 [Melanomma pulvis-pyrius CBS 109.77]|uniref:Uncharacterized protein n=1 Tax=Melanomma pulvis-pyrius CBS 109.77 TaxID=1314802 RepID=A0A6A6XYW6_9PLEO|nr:hypothetical protein K505DRAFT_813 [Melanomma pulvis-pyrius CBS 109.77]